MTVEGGPAGTNGGAREPLSGTGRHYAVRSANAVGKKVETGFAEERAGAVEAVRAEVVAANWREVMFLYGIVYLLSIGCNKKSVGRTYRFFPTFSFASPPPPASASARPSLSRTSRRMRVQMYS